MKSLLALAFALALLFGCTGVPQEKYDTLKVQCEQEKQGISAQLQSEESKVGGLTAKISECNDEKQTLNAVILTKDSEIAVLKNDSGILMQARAKEGRMQRYGSALASYNEAYGPGKIPNSVRLSRIETAVLSLNDSGLYASWKGVRNCDGILGCENAKSNFTRTIDGRLSALAFEIAEIVK